MVAQGDAQRSPSLETPETLRGYIQKISIFPPIFYNSAYRPRSMLLSVIHRSFGSSTHHWHQRRAGALLDFGAAPPGVQEDEIRYDVDMEPVAYMGALGMVGGTYVCYPRVRGGHRALDVRRYGARVVARVLWVWLGNGGARMMRMGRLGFRESCSAVLLCVAHGISLLLHNAFGHVRVHTGGGYEDEYAELSGGQSEGSRSTPYIFRASSFIASLWRKQPPRTPVLPGRKVVWLRKKAVRSFVVYATMRGGISENAYLPVLAGLDSDEFAYRSAPSRSFEAKFCSRIPASHSPKSLLGSRKDMVSSPPRSSRPSNLASASCSCPKTNGDLPSRPAPGFNTTAMSLAGLLY
ncbi:hypothetical protein R3P38DRAFT_2797645 [Favolaschia claudopus]|uniref:Uncharacterized protein n=1 Tax=Favolaschia claudopus TaxID=2862362 RepID=A0AAW0A3C5_9AGAR